MPDKAGRSGKLNGEMIRALVGNCPWCGAPIFAYAKALFAGSPDATGEKAFVLDFEDAPQEYSCDCRQNLKPWTELAEAIKGVAGTGFTDKFLEALRVRLEDTSK